MDKTLKLIEQALQSDPEYKTSLTGPLDMLYWAYHKDNDKFDAMTEALKKIERQGK